MNVVEGLLGLIVAVLAGGALTGAAVARRDPPARDRLVVAIGLALGLGEAVVLAQLARAPGWVAGLAIPVGLGLGLVRARSLRREAATTRTGAVQHRPAAGRQPVGPVPGYTVEGILGSGAAGTVYRACRVGDGTVVAIKVLHPTWRADPSFVAGFRTEALVMRTLDDPHCVRFYEFVETDELVALVTAYVDGSTLRAVLQHAGRLSGEQALGVVSGAVRGLIHLHSRGLVHRDIKPENILVDRAGVSQLADYGLARPGSAYLGAGGPLEGSPAYLSPEAISGAAIGPWSDLYACGALLFELFAGAPPFRASSLQELFDHHVHTDAPDLRTVVPQVSPQLAAVVARALAKDPARRQPDAAVLLAELTAAATSAYGPAWELAAHLGGLVAASAALGAATVAAVGGSLGSAAAAAAGTSPALGVGAAAGAATPVTSTTSAGTVVAGTPPPAAHPAPPAAHPAPPAAHPLHGSAPGGPGRLQHLRDAGRGRLTKVGHAGRRRLGHVEHAGRSGVGAVSASAVAVVAVGVHLALASSVSVPTALVLLTGPAGKPGAVLPVDLDTGKAGRPIPVGIDPVAIAVAPGGGTAYVLNSGSGDVTPVDLADGKPEPAIAVGKAPNGIVIAPNGHRAYILDGGARTLTPLDLATDRLGPPVLLNEGTYGFASPASLAMSPTGNLIMVSDNYQLIAVRIPADVVTHVYGFGLPPEVGDVVVGPSGTLAYSDNVMYVGVTHLTSAPVPAGQPGGVGIFDPGGLLFGPPHDTLYVQSGANPSGIIPVDVQTMTKETLIPLPVSAMALAPGSTTLWGAAATGLVPIDLLTRTIGKPWVVRVPPSYSDTGFVVTTSGLFG